jgi:DNA-binding transcriptional LysR family regulator
MAKAARDLGMAQPSVSEAIAKLGAALRVRLLARGPRGIQPTIYADALLRREQVVSDELQQCIRDIEFLSNPAAGEVRVGCPENLACGFVPTITDRLSHRYPKIAFHVTPVEPAAMGFREPRERSVDLMVGRIVHPPWTTTWMRKSCLRIGYWSSPAPAAHGYVDEGS